ncbi:unnamed protein product [Psylliodes chrysocephalus]|uniref:Uncharacterized protein n=1 Tax=Psylliodes chrysocephalus TaxID=3402493 RepID=A0A9P0C7Q0_9CUCU|nr:unnamed protein product [Psylliodes chrysocephala]
MASPRREEPEDFETENDSSDSDFECDLGTPKPFNQDHLNDLIRDRDCQSQLQRRKIFGFKAKRKKIGNEREHNFLKYFVEGDYFVFCKDVPGLMATMGLQNYVSSGWRLFIDSSKRSLKCVLLHNGNKLESLLIAHSTKV